MHLRRHLRHHRLRSNGRALPLQRLHHLLHHHVLRHLPDPDALVLVGGWVARRPRSQGLCRGWSDPLGRRGGSIRRWVRGIFVLSEPHLHRIDSFTFRSIRCVHSWSSGRSLQGWEGGSDHRALLAVGVPRRIHPNHGFHGLQRGKPGLHQSAGRWRGSRKGHPGHPRGLWDGRIDGSDTLQICHRGILESFPNH